jgi:hypothetical protein
MLKIRDLGINIIPAMMPAAGSTRGYFVGWEDGDYAGTSGKCADVTCHDYADMGSTTCFDMSCGGEDVYRRKPTKKKPSKKKAPAKKPSKKTPSKKGSKKRYRTAGFGSAAIAQLGRQLEEQLRSVH